MNTGLSSTTASLKPSSVEPRPDRKEPAGRTRVMLLGVTNNTNNYGVRVLLSGAVACLARAYRSADIGILDYAHNPASWTEPTDDGGRTVEVVNLRFSWKLYLPNNIFRLLAIAGLVRLIPSRGWRKKILSHNPWLRAALEAEAHFALSGGDSFSDIYRLERLFYVALPQILVLWLGKPLILLPQTYGPFKGWIARAVARYIFRRSAKIYSRDAGGVATVKRIGGPDLEVQVVPDLGLAMMPEPVDAQIVQQLAAWRAQGPLVGLNISKLLYIGGYTRNNMFGLKENFPDLMRALIDFLVRETKAFILLVPHVYGGPESQESELTLCRELYPELQKAFPGRIGFFDQTFNHRQAKYIIGQCDVFTGARMHACIAAVSQCVPTVAQAYSDKFAGVMAVVGADIKVLDLRDADVRQTCEALQEAILTADQKRRLLAARMPDIVNRIRQAFAIEIAGGRSAS